MITSELRAWILTVRAENLCEVCSSPLICGHQQLAHRIAKTVANLARFGEAVIDHPKNLVAVESLECNSSVLVSGKEAEELAAEIKRAIAEEESEQEGHLGV